MPRFLWAGLPDKCDKISLTDKKYEETSFSLHRSFTRWKIVLFYWFLEKEKKSALSVQKYLFFVGKVHAWSTAYRAQSKTHSTTTTTSAPFFGGRKKNRPELHAHMKSLFCRQCIPIFPHLTSLFFLLSGSGWLCRSWRRGPLRRCRLACRRSGKSFWLPELPAPSMSIPRAMTKPRRTSRTPGATLLRMHRCREHSVCLWL